MTIPAVTRSLFAQAPPAQERPRELTEVVMNRPFGIESDLARVSAHEAASERFGRNGSKIVLFDRGEESWLHACTVRHRFERQALRLAGGAKLRANITTTHNQPPGSRRSSSIAPARVAKPCDESGPRRCLLSPGVRSRCFRGPPGSPFDSRAYRNPINNRC